MFNKVTHGFGAAVAALGQGDFEGAGDDAAIASLAEGLADGVSAETQRDAAERLRDLLLDHPQTQAAVGSAGLPALAAALKRAPRGAGVVLEALALALGDGLSGGQRAADGKQPSISAAAINCELFSRDGVNLAAVLAVLGPPPVDVAARVHALQLLASLAAHAAPRLVAAILASPGSLDHVIASAGDAHPAVAGEARSLLLALARASPDVQKIAAYNGAFDRLLNDVRAAGGVAGPVAVQDALELAAALAAGNAATRTLLLEGGHVPALVSFLASDAGRKPTPQRAANAGAALDLVGTLVASGPPATGAAAAARTACQEALLQQGALSSLLGLCLDNGGFQDDGVRVKAMRVLGQLVDGHAGGQQALARATISVVGRPLPVVQALLRTALRAPAAAERAAGDAVLRCLCFRNEGVQMELLATVTPVPPGSLPSTFGQELVRGLLNADATLAVPSASVAAHLLRGSPTAKARLLQLPVEAPVGTSGPLRYILPTLAGHLVAYFEAHARPDEEQTRAIAMAASMLLAVWLADCPAAISALLAAPSLLDTFVAVICDKPPACDDFVRSLAAVLLGECLLFCGDDVKSKAVAHDAIMGRIGLAKFLAVADAMRMHPALTEPDPVDRHPAHPVLDADLRAFLVDFEARLNFCIMPAPAAPPPRTSDDAAAGELAHAQATIASLESQLHQLRMAPPPPNFAPAHPEPAGDVAGLQARCADLQTTADAARADADAARAAAAKVEADLASLAAAYASLQAHASSLEDRIASLGAPAGPAADPADVERRIAEAAAEATAVAEDGVNDLLVCLGQEERKVELLTAKLAELGVDAGPLVAGVGDE